MQEQMLYNSGSTQKRHFDNNAFHMAKFNYKLQLN